MTLNASRWHVIAESNFAWEREALEWLRAHLPDRDSWHVWTNFEFIDDEGKVNEVDALVLSPAGLFLVEIKSRPGVLRGDAHSWTWTTDGRTSTYDNPLILANRKAKRLANLLRRQPAIVKAKVRLPFVEPAIFLSSSSLACQLEGLAKTATYQHGRPGSLDDSGIIGALSNGITTRAATPVDVTQARAIGRAVIEAGIRPSNKHRQVGDYKLTKLAAEGDGFQDWEASHVSVDTIRRRVRIYTVASASTPEMRAARLRQARREFEVLEGIDHPGILRVNDLKETELGPALIFEHSPKAVRLDHLLREKGKVLTITQRLQMVRDIAETLKYAHAKRLYHRALGPQSVMVYGADTGAVQVRLMNWQTASRNVSASAGANTVHRTTGTRHVEDYVEDPGLLYLAPETTRADPAHGASLDVFSLGCIAFYIFSGQPPAESTLELAEKLRVGQGLRLSDTMDGCGARQQDLIQFATAPDLLARYDTIQGFLDDLDLVEDELTTPDPEITVDPSIASAGDRLVGGFTVVKRMGRGSSSDALLVRRDGSDDEAILKVACDIAHNERLVAEGEVLARLHHQNIVAHRETLTVSGRTALLLKSAGAKTLAEKLKEEGRLSLDMLQRFGEELIEAVNHLESEGVAHRDIKPENIGISENRSGKLQLVLFDFSLCRTPASNITAGTHPYLDPFLSLRRPPRWDLYAERFALAVTLYEMAVGQPPVWGDGQTSPAMLDVEASIERDVFDPVTREGFAGFFEKALRRDFRERFDNAEDMLRDWRAIFTARRTVHPSDVVPASGLAAIAPTATPQTTMAELGYSLEAQDVLERMGVHNARELLAVDRIVFRYLKGVGDKIRKEIRLTAKELARLRPDLTQGRSVLLDSDEEVGRAVSINELATQLLPRRPAGDDRPEEAALAYYLGLDDVVKAGAWPSLGDSAQAGEVDRTILTTTLIKARERWLKNPAFTELRHQIDALVRSQGHVMSTREGALALLALRGCASQDDAERLRQATSVLRGALEAEAHLDQPRFEVYEHQPYLLIASAAPWADYARQLGAAADACAMADPLLPPARVLELLEGVSMPSSEQLRGAAPAPLTPTRLLRLAASASRKAAVSSRQEMYARGMAPIQALRQSLGALVGALELRVKDIQDRVRGRYPEASALPDRPSLDRLLEEAGAPLTWDVTAADGRGAYRLATMGRGQTAGTTTQFSRHATLQTTHVMGDGDADQAAVVEERLVRSLEQGGLLVLTVHPRIARRADAELIHRFGGPVASPTAVRRLNVDALLLAALREQARAMNVDWNVVLQADAADRGSRHWTNLQRLVQRSVATIRADLLNSPSPILLVCVGLLARYELMSLVTELEELAGRPGYTPCAWVLIPTSHQGLPVIDGVAVPLVNNINNTRALALPQAWMENAHRAKSGQNAGSQAGSSATY
ncbi:serine/threonine-protein kinase PrkC [Janthinobacterium sp. HH104]|uniref:BREX system serine/threonine kinase PglW n=1 Tax=Janthinobacterium sp. HH104 TaxID=1537276 RepID=UPI0008740431|nr:BREX system serine/threonine kinase PglW [Janthinobacterium sp. HH104]OEZ83351.1 serine/threonine-protein kinase PrkC [Janthinobacterium sp. HH104]